MLNTEDDRGSREEERSELKTDFQGLRNVAHRKYRSQRAGIGQRL